MHQYLYGRALLSQRTAMERNLRRDRYGFFTVRQIIGLVIVIGILVGGFMALYVKQPPTSAAPRRAGTGGAGESGHIRGFWGTRGGVGTSYAPGGEEHVS